MLLSVKRFFRQIKHVIDWLPLLWHDQDWDWVYLVIIMKFKLERMKECLDDGWSIRTKKEDKKILIAINCLDRIIKDSYVDKNLDQQYDIKGYKHFDDMDKEWKDKTMALWKLDEYLKKEDLRVFCEIFQKQLRTWWD